MTIETEERRSEEGLEMDQKDLQPAALVFLTYPLGLIAFVFLAILVLWSLGYFSHNEPTDAQVPAIESTSYRVGSYQAGGEKEI